MSIKEEKRTEAVCAAALCAGHFPELLSRALLQLLLRVPFYGSVYLLLTDFTLRRAETASRVILWCVLILSYFLLVMPARFCWGQRLRNIAGGRKTPSRDFFMNYGRYLKLPAVRLPVLPGMLPLTAALVFLWHWLNLMDFTGNTLVPDLGARFTEEGARSTQLWTAGITAICVIAGIVLLLGFICWQLYNGCEYRNWDGGLRRGWRPCRFSGKRLLMMAVNFMLGLVSVLPALLGMLFYITGSIPANAGIRTTAMTVLALPKTPLLPGHAGLVILLAADLLLLYIPLRVYRDMRKAVRASEEEKTV
ncbi:MAG: hypothetical protein CW338_07780 [Clostridiales bacterium]|nr:hypothetical protein [Clostridiales bacterium]